MFQKYIGQSVGYHRCCRSEAGTNFCTVVRQEQTEQCKSTVKLELTLCRELDRADYSVSRPYSLGVTKKTDKGHHQYMVSACAGLFSAPPLQTSNSCPIHTIRCQHSFRRLSSTDWLQQAISASLYKFSPGRHSVQPPVDG
jgi:hypothetical protein